MARTLTHQTPRAAQDEIGRRDGVRRRAGMGVLRQGEGAVAIAPDAPPDGAAGRDLPERAARHQVDPTCARGGHLPRRLRHGPRQRLGASGPQAIPIAAPRPIVREDQQILAQPGRAGSSRLFIARRLQVKHQVAKRRPGDAAPRGVDHHQGLAIAIGTRGAGGDDQAGRGLGPIEQPKRDIAVGAGLPRLAGGDVDEPQVASPRWESGVDRLLRLRL